uniref:Uncharacterized protein n=1 Tax=Cacopsylla melanoneura TaxID=428564 RepID=A0A8D8WA21_9HEMI
MKLINILLNIRYLLLVSPAKTYYIILHCSLFHPLTFGILLSIFLFFFSHLLSSFHMSLLLFTFRYYLLFTFRVFFCKSPLHLVLYHYVLALSTLSQTSSSLCLLSLFYPFFISLSRFPYQTNNTF